MVHQACQGRKAKVNSIFSYITAPYVDEETGEQIITVCQEVKYKDVVQGVVAMDIEHLHWQTMWKISDF